MLSTLPIFCHGSNVFKNAMFSAWQCHWFCDMTESMILGRDRVDDFATTRKNNTARQYTETTPRPGLFFIPLWHTETTTRHTETTPRYIKTTLRRGLFYRPPWYNETTTADVSMEFSSVKLVFETPYVTPSYSILILGQPRHESFAFGCSHREYGLC